MSTPPKKKKPRIKIYGYYGVPVTPAIALNLSSEKEWRGAVSRQDVTNLRRYNFKSQQNDTEEEGVSTGAISLDYNLHSLDSRVSQWTQILAESELEYRKLTLDALNTERIELSAKENPKDEEKSRLADVKNQIAQLQAKGSGYFEETPNTFGDGRSSLYRRLSVPNIPFDIRSNFKLEGDRPFTLWLYRFKPDEKQEDLSFKIEWDKWRLEFQQDGQIELTRFSTEYTDKETGRVVIVDARERIRLEAELNQVLDKGRLTAADKLFIEAQKDAVKAIKKMVKDSGRSDEEMSSGEKQGIKAAEDAIDNLREEKKGLTLDETAEADTLKEYLYKDSVQVNLHEQSQSIFGVPLRLTFLPHEMGLTITLEGNEPWTYLYEIPFLPGTEDQLEFVWDDTPMRITGNGGSFIFKWGYPVFKTRGRINFSAFAPNFEIPENSGEEADKDIQTRVVSNGEDEVDYRFKIDYKTPMIEIPLPPPFTESLIVHSTYYYFLELFSDGKYPVWVYDIQTLIPAGDRTGSQCIEEEKVWDSEDHLDSMGFPPILDINVEQGDDRETYVILLRDVKGRLGLPLLKNRLIDIYLEDEDSTENETFITPLAFTALIKTVDYEDIATHEQGQASAKNETIIKLGVVDMSGALDDVLLTDSYIGDSRILGEYIFQLVTASGALAEEMSGIDQTMGGPLPSGRTGSPPTIKPSNGARVSDYIQSLLDRYGYNIRFGVKDGVYTLWQEPDRVLMNGDVPPPEGEWGIDSDGNPFWIDPVYDDVDVVFKAEFSSNPDAPTRYRVHTPLTIPLEDSDFYNFFIIEGQKNRFTNKRISKVHLIQESIYDENHPSFLGRYKPYPPVTDDGLQTEDDLTYTLESLVWRYGQAGHFIQWETFYHPNLKLWDWIRIDGIPVQIIGISGTSLKEDTMSLVTRRLFTNDGTESLPSPFLRHPTPPGDWTPKVL